MRKEKNPFTAQKRIFKHAVLDTECLIMHKPGLKQTWHNILIKVNFHTRSIQHLFKFFRQRKLSTSEKQTDKHSLQKSFCMST